MAVSDALPLKAAWHDSIAKLNFWGLRIWAADKPNAVSFRLAVGRHVNAAYSVCNGPGTEEMRDVLGTEQNTEGG